MIVKQLTYELTDPTIDSQIVSLQTSGADTFVQFSSSKFAAQAIRKMFDIGWRPLHFLFFASASLATLKTAGLDKSAGIVSAGFLKDPNDPRWQEDPGMKEWRVWLDKYYPEGDKSDGAIVYAYLAGQTLMQVLRQCGNDLSRENIMRQAANLHDLELPLLLPGIRINTSPTDYRPNQAIAARAFQRSPLGFPRAGGLWLTEVAMRAKALADQRPVRPARRDRKPRQHVAVSSSGIEARCHANRAA